MSTETLDQTSDQVLIEAENTRTFLRGAIARLATQSRVIPLSSTSSNDILLAIESTARQQNITLTLGKTAVVGVTADGTRLGTIEMIEKALLANKHLCDGRSVRHLADAGSDVTRDEMTVAQKSAYIDAHGADAYLALNAQRTPTFSKSPDTLTRTQWLSMKRPEKVALNFTERQIALIMGRK
jgi:hypothetical protein